MADWGPGIRFMKCRMHKATAKQCYMLDLGYVWRCPHGCMLPFGKWRKLWIRPKHA